MKGNLTTDDNGSVVLKNLHLGTYVIREVQAPENFYNAGEEKTVTLSYAGQNVETVFSESTFHNDRQKAEVSVLKQDKDTLNTCFRIGAWHLDAILSDFDVLIEKI